MSKYVIFWLDDTIEKQHTVLDSGINMALNNIGEIDHIQEVTSDTCLFGACKTNTKDCPMIYIHIPGYYPTKELYKQALRTLCPNLKGFTDENICPVCGKKTTYIDYPDMIKYHIEDTEWGIPPMTDEDPYDPGMLVAKAGAAPAERCRK